MLPANLIAFVDGSCNPNPGGIAVSAFVIYDESDTILAQDSQITQQNTPQATSNYAEYAAVLLLLKHLKDWQGHLIIKSDSKLLVHQLRNEWQCKSPHLIQLRNAIWDMNIPFEILWIPRKQNQIADKLSKNATTAPE